jgi:hypothetical protein
MRKHPLVLFALALLLGAASPARAADPVAVMVRMDGAVRVQRAAAAAAVAGAVGMQLAPGDQVLVPAGGRAVLLYRTGRTETLVRSTRLQPPRGAQRTNVFRQTVRTLGEVAATDARSQPNRQGMIRPIAGASVPISPRNGVVVRDARPRFVWFAVPGAEGYVVQLRKADGQPTRYSVAATDTAWSLPAEAPALEEGAAYEWTVTTPEGRAAEVQKFRVATPAERVALDRELEAIRAAGLNPAGDGLILTAVAYRNAGMHYDALRSLDALAASGVPLGRDFHLLRAAVYDRLGMLPSAEKSYAAADGSES